METYTQSFDRRESFRMHYRVRRADGEYRWVLDIGVPRFNSDGSFAGYIGSAMDVTEQKLAQEALSGVSRRLIQAQEKERVRIARELHDDINQRIAMLAVDVGRLRQTPPDSLPGLEQRLSTIEGSLADISSELQAISHRLHSSKLDYLGLTAACKSFCTELAERQGVTIDFRAEGVPEAVPQEIAICLFRVLQESLNNAFKHSFAQRFEVRLQGLPREVQLKVRDYGMGFDVNAATNGRGLGLISMRERVSLVNGTLSIASNPRLGTEIRVSIPSGVTSGTAQITGAA
jgi:signal transduction histidine kinase